MMTYRKIWIGLTVTAVLVMVLACFTVARASDDPVRLEVAYANPIDSADWQNLIITGTNIELTAQFVGGVESGFTSQGEPSLYATIVPGNEEGDMTFSQIVHGTFYWGPKGHNLFKGSYARTGRVFDADEHGGKIVFFLPPAATELTTPTPPIETGETETTAIPEGDYFILSWYGNLETMRPDRPWSWVPCENSPLEVTQINFYWEHEGWNKDVPPVVGSRRDSLGGNKKGGGEITPLSELFPTFQDQRGLIQFILGGPGGEQPEYWGEGDGPSLATEYLPARKMVVIISYCDHTWQWDEVVTE